MTCGAARETILDLARDVAIDASARAGTEEHLRGCPSCAAELERQRDLTAAFSALAAEAATWKASPGLEERVQAAFAAQVPVAPPPLRESSSSERWSGALTLAAVVILAVWLGRRPATQPAPEERSQAPVSALSPSPSVSRVPEQAGRKVGPIAAVRSTDQRATARGFKLPRRAAAATRVQSFEFMTLPGAVGLPDLESGSVVRIAVPVGALPEYGLDILTIGSTTTVEADVLVGQDGMARAIRLVGGDEGSPQDTRSRR